MRGIIGIGIEFFFLPSGCSLDKTEIKEPLSFFCNGQRCL